MPECKICSNGCVEVKREQPHTKYRSWISNQPDDEQIVELMRERRFLLSFLQVGGLCVTQ